MNTITINAKITKKGEILIANKELWLEFLQQNKGRETVGEFKVYTGKEADRQLSYFKNVMLPQLQLGFLSHGDQRSRENIIELLTSEYYKPVEDLEQLSTIELTEFIKFVERYAAENFDNYKTQKI